MYDTATHTRLGKLERPASAAADPGAPCSMLWRGERELLICWGRHVTVCGLGGLCARASLQTHFLLSTPVPACSCPSFSRCCHWLQVVRIIESPLAEAQQQQHGHPASPAAAATAAMGGLGRSLQIVSSFDAGCTALGAAPFGSDLAVLTWGALEDSGSGGGGATGTESGAAPLIAVRERNAGEVPPACPSPSPSPRGLDAAAQHPAPTSSAEQLGREQEQELSLRFYSRAGQLLASDALGTRCATAERRWRQLALIYPGDADVRLPSSSSGSNGDGEQGLPASAAGVTSPAASFAGSPAPLPSGSLAEAAAEAEASGAWGKPQQQKDQAAEEVGSSSRSAAQKHQRGQQVQQQYQWWREGEDPMYFVSCPEVRRWRWWW